MTDKGGTAEVRGERWLCGLCLLVLSGFALAYLAVAWTRLAYPYDLDFLEDDVLLEAWRFAAGLPVFAAPNADFVPHAYAPLYMLLSAGLFRLTGVGYLPMRLLSLAATLASACVLYATAYAASGRRAVALSAPGLFLAGYAVTGMQYELARVDALSIALLLAGTLAGIRGADTRRGRVAAAVLLALAFFAKQTALVFGPVMGLYLLLAARRRAVDFLAVYGLAVAVPLGLMHLLTGGWSTTYLLVVPQSDPVALERVVSYVRHDLTRGLGALGVVLAVAAWLRWSGRRSFLDMGGAWLPFTLAAVCVSGWARARLGGNTNSLMPAYAYLCALPAIALGDSAPWTARPGWLRPAAIYGTYAAILAQCALGIYRPWEAMPTAAMQQSGNRLIASLSAAPGPVLVLEHPYYALLAGKAPGVSLTALWHASGRGATGPPADLAQRLRGRYYAEIIADEGTYPEVEALVEDVFRESYRPGTALADAEAPPTLAGLLVRPRFVFVPQ